jgi:hypothetical protein
MDKNEDGLSFFAQQRSWAKSAIAGPTSLSKQLRDKQRKQPGPCRDSG